MNCSYHLLGSYKVPCCCLLSVGSYYATQLVGNVLVTATAMYTCTSSALGFKILHLIYMLALFGINVVGSNLMCHRYLHEKATIMVKM